MFSRPTSLCPFRDSAPRRALLARVSALVVLLIVTGSSWAGERPESPSLIRFINRQIDEDRSRCMERILGFGIARSIDRHIDQRLHAKRISASPQAGDGEYCR